MSKKYGFKPGLLPWLMIGAVVLLTLIIPVPTALAQTPEGEAMGDEAIEGDAMGDKAMAGDQAMEGEAMEDKAMAGDAAMEGDTMADKTMTGQESAAMLPVTGADYNFPAWSLATLAAGLLLLGGGVTLHLRRR